MFDAQQTEIAAHPLRVATLAQMAREGGLALGRERSYMAPVLFWIGSGQGRFSIEGDLRGYTAHNAIFLPANLSHSIEISPRSHGTAIFFADQNHLPFPPALLHLRLQGVQAQSEMNSLVEALRAEAAGKAADRDLMLHHRAALMLLWLGRQSGCAKAPERRVSDMLRSIAQPKR